VLRALAPRPPEKNRIVRALDPARYRVFRCYRCGQNCWPAPAGVFSGQSELALEHLQNYLRLGRRERMGTCLNGTGDSHFFSRRFDRWRQTYSRHSNWPRAFGELPGSGCMLCAYGPARRSARNRKTASRDHAARDGARDMLPQPGAPRAVPVRPGAWRRAKRARPVPFSCPNPHQ
jgi:hypothetical protein